MFYCAASCFEYFIKGPKQEWEEARRGRNERVEEDSKRKKRIENDGRGVVTALKPVRAEQVRRPE